MRRALFVGLLLAIRLCAAEAVNPASVIQSVELNAARPYFVPTHPRVTTTVRFPGEIGPPDGAVTVFTEDAAKAAGEYLVTWQQGDAYFTLTPLREAQMANLNVPYQGSTYVFYFYPVSDPLTAIASVNLVGAGEKPPPLAPAAGTPRSTNPSSPPQPAVTRQSVAPAPETVPATPARLVGFLDRLKLLHATTPGPTLTALGLAMGVQIARTREDQPVVAGGTTPPADDAIGLASGMNDAGLYQIILLRAVRDPRINCVGFICLVRNTSNQVLAFDVNSFGARAGAEYLMQRVSDAVPLLKPGEQAPAYFIVAPPGSSPLRADNAWRISADLVSPRVNPGAGISRGFSGAAAAP